MAGHFDGFNLSDIFEYMSPDQHEACYLGLIERASPGARLVYWNMLVPRSMPDTCAGSVISLDELSTSLHAQDRAFFYQALRVDEVSRGE